MNTENIDKSLFEFAAFDEMESEHIAAPRYSYWKSVWRTFFRNKFTVAVAVLLLAVIIFALIQPTKSGYSPINTPNINNADMKFLKPSAEHIFGTDHVGNEVLTPSGPARETPSSSHSSAPPLIWWSASLSARCGASPRKWTSG